MNISTKSRFYTERSGCLYKFKCPVNYDINKCSSKEFGLSCETCCHKKDRTNKYIKTLQSLSKKDMMIINKLVERDE